MPQTVWKGTISFGLVSIPVRLSTATEERNISFRQVRASDGARVRYRRVAETDGAEVATVCDLASVGGDEDAADARQRRMRELLSGVTQVASPAGHTVKAGFSRPHDGLAALPEAAIEHQEELDLNLDLGPVGRLI